MKIYLPFTIHHSPFKFYFFTHKKWGHLSPFFIPPLCSMLYALCSMLYALCSMLYALCSMLYALCSMLYALCSMLYALNYIAFSSLKLKLVPLSTFESTVILLPCAWTMCFTMDRPRPVPPLSLVRLLSIR
jgi:hypothetical protein